jgi:hypothetical protein
VKLGRLRYPDWIAGISGAALIGLLFAPWYEAKPAGGLTAYVSGPQTSSFNAWQAFGVADIVLAAIGAMGVALFVVTAAYRTPAMSIALGALTCLAAIVAVVIVVVKLLSDPSVPPDSHPFTGPADVSPDIGAYLGLAGALGLAVGSWLSVEDQRPGRAILREQARRGRPGIHELPAPPPGGRTAAGGNS